MSTKTYTISNQEQPKLSLEEMCDLVEKAKKEREGIPEAILMAESTKDLLVHHIRVLGATKEERAALTNTGNGRFASCLYGTPVFTCSDRDAHKIPIHKKGETPKVMGTDHILAGYIEDIQKILNWLRDINTYPLPDYLKFKFDAAVGKPAPFTCFRRV